MITVVRHKVGEAFTPRKFAPKEQDTPEDECPVCGCSFEAGEHVTLIPLGPGTDPVARQAARQGGWFNAIAIEAHWSCVTGDET